MFLVLYLHWHFVLYDKDGVQHNRIVTVAVKFYPAVEKEEEVPSKPAKEAKKGKK